MTVLLPDGSVRQLRCPNCRRELRRLSDLRADAPTFRMDDWREDDGRTYSVKVFVGHTLHCASCVVSRPAR